MNEFRYSGYYTECSYLINGIWKDSGNHACFADLLRNYDKGKPKFKVNLYKLGGRTQGNASVCLVDEKGISNHLRQVQDIVDFDYSIEAGEKKYTVTLKISAKEPNVDLCCRFILTWLRYLYEFPYNVIMIDVNRLKQNLPPEVFESGINLFGVVAYTYSGGDLGDSYNTGHTIHYRLGRYDSGNCSRLASKSYLKKQLKRKDITRVNSIIPEIRIESLRILGRNCFSGVRDLEFWEDDKCFLEQRLPALLENYKKLKDKKLYE